MKKINLFCFPFAGGNKYSYREYEQVLPSFLNLIPVEYPGRGARSKEPFITNMDELIDDLYARICHTIDEADYAFYGHSMGGVVAYFLIRKIIDRRHRMPLHLFITGTTGPSAVSREEKKRHLMGEREFIDEIKELDGCPEEVLQNKELWDYFEPVLRADFAVSEAFSYVYDDPFDIPMTVITGAEEDMEATDIHLWQQETTCTVDFRQMPGKHFFILKYPHEVVQIIAEKIFPYTKAFSS